MANTILLQQLKGEQKKDLSKWVAENRERFRWKVLSKRKIAQLNSTKFNWLEKDQTIFETKGLMSEKKVIEKYGLSSIAKYRKDGLIKPCEIGLSRRPLYHSKQIHELKKKLGITLDGTKGLLSERQFYLKSKITHIADYRKQGLIKPIGWALPKSHLSAFYHPRQINQLKKKLGITLKNTKGLLSERQFAKKSGLSQIAKYRKRGLIEPVGYAPISNGVGPHYHPSQIKKLKKKLDITLDKTSGLLNEKQFAKITGFSRIANYRKRGLIKPFGFAMTKGGTISAHYKKIQLNELKKKLKITLSNTKGLLNRKQFLIKVGIPPYSPFAKKLKTKSYGRAFTLGGNISDFYHPKQIIKLRNKLGITVNNVKGLLNENKFREKSGLYQIKKYRTRGYIKPYGFAWVIGGVRPFYHPRQIEELKEKLGITLNSTKGLLTTTQFAMVVGISRLTKNHKFRVKPIGYAIKNGPLTAFYSRKQIKEFKRSIGITLNNTKDLLSEPQVARMPGLSNILRYRKKELVKPSGKHLTASKVSYFYHPRQIKKLRQRLKKRV